MRGISSHNAEPPSVTVVKLFDAGKSVKQIMGTMRSPAAEIRKFLTAAGRLQPIIQDFDWTPERVEML